MDTSQMPVLLLDTVEPEQRTPFGFVPDDTHPSDLGALQRDFEEERNAEALCVCGQPIPTVRELTRRSPHVMADAKQRLVNVVRTVAGTAPPEAVVALGEDRRPLIKAFVVRSQGTPTYPLPRAVWGWVSESVPPQLADAVRRVLDPVGSARWN